MAKLPSGLIWSGSTCQLLGPSEPTYVHIAICMACGHQSLFFLVPVGMKDDVATVPMRTARCEAASWPNCHLIWSGSTCQLLGPSGPTYVRSAICMACSHQRLLFLVPFGMKDDVATVTMRTARCEAASWPNCLLIWSGSTCQLLGPIRTHLRPQRNMYGMQPSKIVLPCPFWYER